jgi:hypothetical protein
VSYPAVLGEDETLDAALAGRSIARIGEGELRIAIGQRIKSQRRDDRLAAEMRMAMREPGSALLCLPRLWVGMPAEPFWRKFAEPPFAKLYGAGPFGSAFISRPDMANAIDRPDYWERCRDLWRDRDVVLASRSTEVLDLSAAASSRFVECPAVDAYDRIDAIEAELGTPAGPVLLAIGATATVLAMRLAKKGVHAIDIGHLGRFMIVAGAYSMERAALISDAYVAQNRALHKRPQGYGGAGHKHAPAVLALAEHVGAASVLDYGSGQGTLKKAMLAAGFSAQVMEYDPAMKGRAALPKPADLVVSTDVLEHVEPDRLAAVLAHIRRLACKAAYLVIATRPAQKVLDDGRNAHLLVKPASWWMEQVAAAGLTVTASEVKEGHSVKLWCMP